MLPGLFRAVYQNGLVCGGTFGAVAEKREQIQFFMLSPAQQSLAQAGLAYCFGEEHQPIVHSPLIETHQIRVF